MSKKQGNVRRIILVLLVLLGGVLFAYAIISTNSTRNNSSNNKPAPSANHNNQFDSNGNKIVASPTPNPSPTVSPIVEPTPTPTPTSAPTLTSSATVASLASANLSNLVISGSPSNYSFKGSTYKYSGITVANAISSITVTPTGKGVIKVNGVIVTSGSASGAIDLTAGSEKTITVTTKQTGKTSKTYTLKITRRIQQVTPEFYPPAGAIAYYNATISISSSGADAIYYTTDGTTPTRNNSLYTAPIDINSDMTIRALAVKNGYDDSEPVTSTYVQATSGDLTNLVISGSPSNFSFSGSTYDYHGVTVPNSDNFTNFIATGSGNITLRGASLPSGNPSESFSLTPGVEETFTFTFAEYGKIAKTYRIYITRQQAPSSLSSLILTLYRTDSQIYVPGVTDYTVSTTQSTVRFTATTAAGNATIFLGATQLTDGVKSGSYNLIIGHNDYTLTVQEPTKTLTTYHIRIDRS